MILLKFNYHRINKYTSYYTYKLFLVNNLFNLFDNYNIFQFNSIGKC